MGEEDHSHRGLGILEIREGDPCPPPFSTVPVTRANMINCRIIMAWRRGGQAPGPSGNKEGQGAKSLHGET